VRQSVLGHDVVVAGAVPMAQLASSARAHLADVGGPHRAGVRVGSGAMAGSARAGETSAASSASEESTMFDGLVSGAVACGCGVSVAVVGQVETTLQHLDPAPGQTAGGFVETVENIELVGSRVVDHIVANWSQWAGGVPSSPVQ
jgi:hypothetical protein